jgi:CHAT domain-containing protein
MQRFYHHLRTLPRDEALRRTQLECLREPETADPYFWAGLRLGGEGGRLSVRCKMQP